MSSTNRGGIREVSDYYFTPSWIINDFLDAWLPLVSIPSPALVLDPCAGGDALHPMAYPTVLKDRGFTVVSVDIREDSPAQLHGNFLETTPSPTYNLVISNPPFSHALDFIRKGLDSCVVGGYVVMLLRLNFFGSQTRSTFFKQHMPTHTFVHSKRPRFSGATGTDSIEYMHAVWQKGNYPKASALYII